MLYLLVVFALVTDTCNGIEKSRGALGSKIFTFIHGDEDAKMNFTAAENYCRSVVGSDTHNRNAIGEIDEESGFIHNPAEYNGDEKEIQFEGLSLKTSLASLHSYPETLAIVRWISKEEKHSFWLGGTVTKTLNEYLRPIYVLHWVDGSSSDFSLFRLPNTELSAIRIGEHKCISVDYLTGQWGVHPCTEKRYFLCLTIPVLSSESTSQTNTVERNVQKKKTRPSKHDELDTPMLHGPLTPEELKELLV